MEDITQEVLNIRFSKQIPKLASVAQQENSKEPNLERVNKSEEINTWLNSIETTKNDDQDDTCSSIVESSIIQSSSSSESGDELELGEWRSQTHLNEPQNILPQMPALTFQNVNISNSTNVYLGHIYTVNGNLNINVIHNAETELVEKLQDTGDVGSPRKSQVVRHACSIFPRYRWLAMDPLNEPKQMLEPAEAVIIGYTATTSSIVQARNIGIIRDYQTLNVEGQGFNDIIYNFLIGCDGVVYEGRGWAIEGDHTKGYNHKSVGIAFVGNFKRDLPTERAFKACKNLIKRGLTECHISKDFKLITSCQCNSNASLDALYEEFKSWEHFCEL